MSDPEPESPLSVGRVVEFIVVVLVLLALLASWVYGLITRWFGA